MALVLGILMLAASPPAKAQDAASPWFSTDQGRVRLIAASPAMGNGDSVTLGLQFELQPHWKIYWRSPGDAGYPPRLDWSGSKNLAAADIAWPAPQRFSVLGLETMGYTDAVVLPITARLIERGKALSLDAALDYLTCNDICIPYETKFRLDLPAGSPFKGAQGYAALIAQYQAQVPGNGNEVGLKILGAAIETGARPALLLRLASAKKLIQPDAFVEGAGEVSFAAPLTMPGEATNETLLRLPAEGKSADIAALAGKSLTVTLVDGSRAMEGTITPALAPASSAPGLDTWLAMLALALAGGLILNFMPCVLPVLALKLLAAVAHHEHGARGVRVGFLASAAGILAAFLGLALFAVGLRLAGLYAGWGLQFQSPLFLGAMIALLLLFAANLWGLYQIPLPGFVAALGERKEALLGSFGAGVLATLLATPCTAPLLGTALGFALASGPAEILAIFAVMGLGLALPYLAVAAMPGLALKLPRPGAWMLELKRVLAVALVVSAAWLGWVLVSELGPPPAATSADFWRPFDAASIPGLVRDGRVVFVDVTADWCLTCKVNERLVLDQTAVRQALAAHNLVAMRADWTRPDPAIARYLREFGRYGIPFNAVYGPDLPMGQALPEILTADRVLTALSQAGGPGR
ncbi:MAG TPA: protein-disulfide reductase DsbD domain-containing protein [Stellaceae bacterium]|nr:protein-disulfide reductase DsbD domain-containing protein [Stellaceae bacterium]